MTEPEEDATTVVATPEEVPEGRFPGVVESELAACPKRNPSLLWLALLVGLCVLLIIGVKRLMKRQNTARLFEAAVLANPERLDGMLEYGAEVNGVIDGDTPLIAASRGGNEGSVKALLARGAEVDPTSVERIPLQVAAANGHVTVAELLLDAGANLERTDQLGRTALCVACAEGEAEMVAYLIRRGSAVAVAEVNAAPVLVAVRGLIDGLPEAPESADAGTARELPAALWERYRQVLAVLVDAGADVDAEGSLGETPLLLAIEADLPTVAEELLDLGADFGKTTAFGSPLLYAVERQRWEVARKLVPTGRESALRGDFGLTALREAVMVNNREFMIFLIANGAGTNVLPDEYDGDSTTAAGTELVITELYRRYTKEMIAMMGDPYDDPGSPVDRAFFRNKLRLNGISDYLTVGERSGAAIESVRTISVSVWLKPRTLGSERLEGQYLVSRHRRGVNTGFELYLDGQMRPVWVIYNGQQPYRVRGDKSLPTGDWSHLAVTSGRGRMEIYVNGRLQGEASVPSVSCEKSGYLHVGRRSSAELGYFAGELQFLAVYPDIMFGGRFEPGIRPVRADEAYVLIRAEEGRVFDQAGHPVTQFPEP